MRAFPQYAAHVALALFLTSAGACIRAGFDQPTETPNDASADTKPAVLPDGVAAVSEANPPAALVVDEKSDTCSTPTVVDLAALASAGETVVLRVDTAAAKQDYSAGCSAAKGWADVVVRFVNAPLSVSMTCEGGGEISVGSPLPGDCQAGAASGTFFCNAMSCGSANMQSINFAKPEILAIIRRPAGAPVARISLKRL